MRVCTCSIIFPAVRTRGRFEVRGVKSCEIEKSFKNLTSTATLELASRGLFVDREINLIDWIKVGDPIQIWLGYDDELSMEFIGYVAGVSPKIPLEIRCEDTMFLLKKTKCHLVKKGITIGQLLKEILPPSISYSILDEELALGEFVIKNSTVAKALEKLKDEYGQFSYFLDTKLIVGKAYTLSKPSIATFHLQKNVVSDSLEYKFNDDLLFKVKAVSHLGGKSTIEVSVGEEGGEERQIDFYNIKNKAELEKLANAELIKLRRNGFSGSFDVMGSPVITMTDVVTLTGSRYPGLQNESYFVDGVSVSFSGGFKRTITLGERVI